jgi:hypothetical protein
MWRSVGVLAVAACSDRVAVEDPTWVSSEDLLPSEPDALYDTAAPESACGDIHEVDFELTGVLVRPQGMPVANASVWLEQRDWGPTVVHGSGTTDADGIFRFTAAAVPIVEGCWAIGPQFFAVAHLGELYAEDGANMEIVQAWLDGSSVADLYQPLVTEQ